MGDALNGMELAFVVLKKRYFAGSGKMTNCENRESRGRKVLLDSMDILRDLCTLDHS